MEGSSIAPRRTYDNRGRRQKAAQTRGRIVSAGSELVREFESWNWRELTFKAVAERAGVGERTVYRHFPTERELHDAVMQRLEVEAGVSYEDLRLADLGAVTAHVFGALHRFSVRETARTSGEAAFVSSDRKRRDAILRAVSEVHPPVDHAQARMMAGLLDVLWSPASYERLVSGWGLDGDSATRAIGWLMNSVAQALEQGELPPA